MSQTEIKQALHEQQELAVEKYVRQNPVERVTWKGRVYGMAIR